MRPARSDRENAARYEQVAHNLRVDAAKVAEFIVALTPDTDRYDTFAVSLLNRVRPLAEEILAAFHDLTDGNGGAQELADTYRSLVERRYSDVVA